MELSNLDKRNLQKDLDNQYDSIEIMMQARFDMETPEDYEKFCSVFGVDLNTSKVDVAISVMDQALRGAFWCIAEEGPMLVAFPNFAKGRGYTMKQLKEFATPEFKNYVYSLLPEYVSKNVDGIMNSCDVLREFCRLQNIMEEQDRIDVANGRIPDRLFANRFDWGF